ncbi:MAG: DUF1320 domain-containing protein [Pseudodesulfovibrio sp.]|uniref:Mu-like prophage protein gp36 n=1 Tax=Pseudodesulfovibrio aespoeensis (strain ATCC 700646 / DSM 10631 / Aspo-2) TaxID=643562 RepID=E6VU98_PSEA9|nr:MULTISPECIES: DUF1320 domain-containing protein [Pseudodesulfovibrio]MBU4191338.1 DUF1320 domain-containing protein [Pseudomonadota bacterium]ADU63405.1 protein of unknown function DUF1320 [Pseudodesulfovibrio aespoeensis Aspo-2]MBU4243452.1 DUF1320 domain-containing protein [Pseudomonadota bacterium]MBU4378630.1 DUF1320 domain-containing protein [Pseudomonadota bacterium]MBU4473786.1 DUF1320 domain-containing protein [Pseudomonadota bacterium]
MSYATETDIIARYGQDQLLVLADRDGDGLADAEVIAGGLADADAEIDAYLAKRYDLPLAEVPPVLTRLAVDIAVYRMCDTDAMATEGRRKRYEDAVSLLRRIGTGEIALGQQPEPQTSSGSASVVSAPRTFRRGIR